MSARGGVCDVHVVMRCPCAGVAAGQRVHDRLGMPWELWVWSEGVVITTPSLLLTS